MFDVGFAELFLLALIGLLVLGPERLPAVARTLGGFVRKARTSWNSLRQTIESELAQADISAPLKKAGEEMKRIGKDLPDIPGFTTDDREFRHETPEKESDGSAQNAGKKSQDLKNDSD
jgi:sec-independent protein translocase protein TatB